MNTKQRNLKLIFDSYRVNFDDYYEAVDDFIDDLNRMLKESYGDIDTIKRSTVLLEEIEKYLEKYKDGFYPNK